MYFLETGTVAVADSAPEHRTDTEELQWCTVFGPNGIDRILYIIAYFSSFKGKKKSEQDNALTVTWCVFLESHLALVIVTTPCLG